MEVLDLLLLAGLAVGLVHGMQSGAVKQIAGVVNLLLAFIISINLMDPVGDFITSWLGLEPAIGPLLGFIIVFVGVEFALIALVKFVESTLDALELGAVNRLVGALVGAVKVGLVMSVILLVLRSADMPDETQRANSQLYPIVAGLVPTSWDYVREVLPEVRSLADRFGIKLLPTDEDDSTSPDAG